MPPTTLHLLGSLAVPLIQWVRYILIVPALIAWGVLLVLAADFAGGGLAGAIEDIVFLPVAGWYFIEALLNPALSPSLTDDTWLEAVGEDPYGFFIRAALVGSLLLWVIRSAWRRVRRGDSSPPRRNIWQSLRRSIGWAVGVTSLFLLTSLLFPHHRTQFSPTTGPRTSGWPATSSLPSWSFLSSWSPDGGSPWSTWEWTD